MLDKHVSRSHHSAMYKGRDSFLKSVSFESAECATVSSQLALLLSLLVHGLSTAALGAAYVVITTSHDDATRRDAYLCVTRTLRARKQDSRLVIICRPIVPCKLGAASRSVTLANETCEIIVLKRQTMSQPIYRPPRRVSVGGSHSPDRAASQHVHAARASERDWVSSSPRDD